MIVPRMQNKRRHTHLREIARYIDQRPPTEELDDNLPGDRFATKFIPPLQLLVATDALISTGIGFFGAISVVALLRGTALIALTLFAVGRRFVPTLIEAHDHLYFGYVDGFSGVPGGTQTTMGTFRS